ncbi:hypothetical protein [Sphingomonas cavernae]|uniref:Uncharacterized protein n=1 Tax=Sphingomonas cavernae TaxID=2320861 RepID=A0A418WPV5_9SPHN|nr:hypothetical protein [Sphingomonas cavernae]RJF93261.1 hypothetical protein D3876_02590 [Sphingomonas cavernae]
MVSKKIALLAAVPLLVSTFPALAQSPAAQRLSLANNTTVAKNVRSGAASDRRSAAAGGNVMGYVIGAIVAGAFIWGAIELISGDDDDQPASP